MYNLLTDPLINTSFIDGTRRDLCLPEIYAALVANEVSHFPALRPHQNAPWHCFLAQLGALAHHRAGAADIAEDAQQWREILRGLTDKFPQDEPWHLIVEDGAKPAFMQAAEPDGIRYTGEAATPDGIDMLIGQKSHDFKEGYVTDGRPEDWIFALITKQTFDGFNGSGNYGIARMNGGSSSRFVMGVAPLSAKEDTILPGARLRHDMEVLLKSRERLLKDNASLDYPAQGGIALAWLEPWPFEDKKGLSLSQLDIWFIEICRRIRLQPDGAGIKALTGTSKSPRIDSKAFKGVVGDPWAPVNKVDKKTITFGETVLDHRYLQKVLFSGDYQLPISLREALFDNQDGDWALIIEVVGRGNSKTYGYHERTIILPRQVRKRILSETKQLHGLSKELVDSVGNLTRILVHAIAIAANNGRTESPKDYRRANDARRELHHLADRDFFPTLWAMLEARLADDEDKVLKAKSKYLSSLAEAARQLLIQVLDTVGTSIFRHRARARAMRRFEGGIRKELSLEPEKGETNNAAA